MILAVQAKALAYGNLVRIVRIRWWTWKCTSRYGVMKTVGIGTDIVGSAITIGVFWLSIADQAVWPL